ncbi:MAG TPA: transcription termination factor NusA [bacterium]|nr:transcription termination factor NusA [bacterium]
MKTELGMAVKRMAAEKNVPEESVVEILEAALVSAYKKDHPDAKGVVVTLNPEEDELRIFALKLVVDEVEEGQEENQVPMLIAKVYDPDAEIEGEVLVEVTPKDFGRIAAQTAKQVVMQRIKEVERDIIFKEYSDKVNEILSGQIRKVEHSHVIINLGRADGILPYREQIPGEHYYQGQRVRALLKEVAQTTKGPQIVMSRADEDFIKRLFELEIPEIYAGTVEIKAIAREAGRRTKIAVAARQEGVDPVGACVGQRGARIQVIMAELGQEKIDIIAYDADPATYIANSLKPAQINQVVINKDESYAVVIVPENQLSLAIGKAGQNVRLAAKLVGWHLDVKSPEEAQELLASLEKEARAAEDEIKSAASKLGDHADDTHEHAFGLTDIKGVGPKAAEKLKEAGFETVASVAEAEPDELAKIDGISLKKAEAYIEAAKKRI